MKDVKIEAIHRAVQEYRSTRANKRVPIPDSIKEKVLVLVGQYSIPYLSKELTLPDGLIYRWKNSESPKALPSKKPTANHFVKLPIDLSMGNMSAGADASGVEFVRADGAKMRIQMTLQSDCLNDLLKSFLGGSSAC